MSNAHDFRARGLGVYRFLGELQAQECVGGLAWTWGALQSAPFLPRVASGRLVLSRASWSLAKEELAALAATRDDRAMFEAVSKLRAARRLPRWVALDDGDNELPIDFENVLSVETFIQLVKRRSHAVVVEMFPDDLCVDGPEGRFAHEIVIPFVKTLREAPAEEPRDTHSGIEPSRRTRPPGSEWLYAKVYTGTAMADRVLVDVLSPMIRGALGAGGAERWFFMRYGDPDWHLRVRFSGDPDKLHSVVVCELQKRMAAVIEVGLVHRLVIDTYEREVERYGGLDGMELSERLFHADSDAVLEILGLLEGAEGADARWRLALRGMDMLLDDLGFDLAAKLSIVERARRSFATEFHVDAALTKTLGAKYRKESRALDAVLDRANDIESPLAPAIEVLGRRSERLAPVAEALRAADRGGRLSLPIADLAASYLHLHANRLLHADARRQELVLYDFLARLYQSRTVRARKGQ
jgi:thiopeptide-type bacteriocin biosynthesis protein